MTRQLCPRSSQQAHFSCLQGVDLLADLYTVIVMHGVCKCHPSPLLSSNSVWLYFLILMATADPLYRACTAHRGHHAAWLAQGTGGGGEKGAQCRGGGGGWRRGGVDIDLGVENRLGPCGLLERPSPCLRGVCRDQGKNGGRGRTGCGEEGWSGCKLW